MVLEIDLWVFLACSGKVFDVFSLEALRSPRRWAGWRSTAGCKLAGGGGYGLIRDFSEVFFEKIEFFMH